MLSVRNDHVLIHIFSNLRTMFYVWNKFEQPNYIIVYETEIRSQFEQKKKLCVEHIEYIVWFGEWKTTTTKEILWSISVHFSDWLSKISHCVFEHPRKKTVLLSFCEYLCIYNWKQKAAKKTTSEKKNKSLKIWTLCESVSMWPETK